MQDFQINSKKAPLKYMMLMLGFTLIASTALGQQVSKIQAAIEAIKEANYCKDQDYHTDGQRVVWVKSYEDWVPSDLKVMKKEAPGALRFLSMAAQRTRYDVLEQLLPDYYRDHGGVKAFAADILRQNVSVK
ncbi:hypothetical protein [Mucilaginibacter sp. HD30]